jgi:hypothetical protein
MEISKYREFLLKPASILPLVVFRIAFGVLMAVASIRFWAKGWIEDLYLKPGFHFHFQGFNWVNVPSETVVYGLFVLKIILAVFIAAGLFYRVSTVLFFLIFTYIELFDKALYLNHNYLVCLLAFYLIFVPAHKHLSLDTFLGRCETKHEVKNLYLLVIKVQLVLVYFFAGLAKLNSDWLISAQPMSIWLKANTEIPLIGALFESNSTAIIMSWGGMLFDLIIPFLLFSKKTIRWAYSLLVVFHLITAVLFPLGMFPWIMIFCTLIFFDFDKVSLNLKDSESEKALKFNSAHVILMVMIAIQICLPFRHLLYRGNSTWHEVGYRFSWKVMKVEKTGSIDFICYDPDENKKWVVSPGDTLTPLQEMQMSYQPDMILEFAQHIRESSSRKIEIYADSWVSMNGRIPQRYVKENIDLAKVGIHGPGDWIHELKEE